MLYVAYGSNLNLDQMRYRCPDAKVVGSGMLHGWKLTFKYHADIIPDEHSSVPVVVFDVSEDDIRSLDMYEGYPRYYITKLVDVELDKENEEYGKYVSAFAYIMTDGNDTLERPDVWYFKAIREGYEDNGLDTEYLYLAKMEAIMSEEE